MKTFWSSSGPLPTQLDPDQSVAYRAAQTCPPVNTEQLMRERLRRLLAEHHLTMSFEHPILDGSRRVNAFSALFEIEKDLKAEAASAKLRQELKTIVQKAILALLKLRTRSALLSGRLVTSRSRFSAVPNWTVSNNVSIHVSSTPRGPSAAPSHHVIERVPTAA